MSCVHWYARRLQVLRERCAAYLELLYAYREPLQRVQYRRVVDTYMKLLEVGGSRSGALAHASSLGISACQQIVHSCCNERAFHYTWRMTGT